MSALGPVLVIDDDPDIREVISQILQELGVSVLQAENGAQALKATREGGAAPCLILLDLMMPVMNGWEFLAQRTSEPALADVPVVVMTATVGAQVDALRVSDHLTKPISYDRLVSVVTRFALSR